MTMRVVRLFEVLKDLNLVKDEVRMKISLVDLRSWMEGRDRECRVFG